MTHSCERLRFVDTCPRCYDHEWQKGRAEGRLQGDGARRMDRAGEREREREKEREGERESKKCKKKESTTFRKETG